MRRAGAVAVALVWALGLGVLNAGHASAQESRTVRVASGDTLWHIAERVFEDGSLWPALYLANRDQIKDPARVYPGQELLVPDVPAGERGAMRREAEALLK